MYRLSSISSPHHFPCWRSIFLSYLPLELIIIVLLLWKVKGEWADARGEKLDITGSAVYCLSLVALMYGFSVLPDILGVGLILLGIIGIAIFISWELKVKAPVLDMNLFRGNTVFTFSVLAALINYSSTFAVSFFLNLYLMLSMGIAMIIFAVLIGKVEITPESYALFLKSVNIAFIIFSVLCFAGVFASLARGKLIRTY